MTLTFLSPCYKNACDYIEITPIIWNNCPLEQGPLLHVLNLITFANSILSPKVTKIHRFLGLGWECLWGHYSVHHMGVRMWTSLGPSTYHTLYTWISPEISPYCSLLLYLLLAKQILMGYGFNKQLNSYGFFSYLNFF